MPEEVNTEKRPVSALLYPTTGLLNRAKEAGELDELLGPGEKGRSVCGRGAFVRRCLPGHHLLGERFFDWSGPVGKFGAMVGRLKPERQVQAVIAGVKMDGAKPKQITGLKIEVAMGVEDFRKAAAAEVAG